MSKKNKKDKPLKINMDFNEMIQRLSNVEKSKVEANIKRKKGKKSD